MRPLPLFTTLVPLGLAVTVVAASAIAPSQPLNSPLGCLPSDLELPQEPPAPTPST